MRAVVYSRYGPPEVLRLVDVPRPRPRDGQVLVRVAASAVTTGDARIRSFRGIPPIFWLPGRLTFGLTRPRHAIPGSQFAGVVEAVGPGVTRFTPGEEVFGCTGLTFGACAEYLALPQDGVMTTRPANLPLHDAAAVPFGALSALHFLRLAGIGPGRRILILGAGGAVGSAAVQLARHGGAHVTGVCSTGKVDLVRDLGADRVIDYTRQDPAASDEPYDAVLDTVGAGTLAQYRRCLKRDGRFVELVFGLRGLTRMLWTRVSGGRRMVCSIAQERLDDLEHVRTLIERGHFRAVVDRRYPLERIVEAHRYVESGHKAGAVTVTIGPDGAGVC